MPATAGSRIPFTAVPSAHVTGMAENSVSRPLRDCFVVEKIGDEMSSRILADVGALDPQYLLHVLPGFDQRTCHFFGYISSHSEKRRASS